MKERKIKFEEIERSVGGAIYIKSVGVERQYFGFWLRFVGQHLHLCDKCQEKLNNILENADEMHIGNKNTEPPIELYRKWEIDDESWKEIKRRPATKEEIIRVENTLGEVKTK